MGGEFHLMKGKGEWFNIFDGEDCLIDQLRDVIKAFCTDHARQARINQKDKANQKKDKASRNNIPRSKVII